MTTAHWQKSSYCSGGGNNCVELAAAAPHGIAIRESSDPDRILTTHATAVAALLDALKVTENRW